MTTPSTNNLNDTYNTQLNKPSVRKFRPQFYLSGRYAFINLDPEILSRLKVTDADEFAEIILNDNEILLKRNSRA